ncbi:mitochondrial carrier protein pet8 protein [Diplodia corticola]|uniref:Mitochondrial carrier protein pet8 protein n=1 Tax=Diplodia corticola TaxID=236234 RepID=A0A1J9SDS2_9PEZI|nr:mitochondrial carrier protein pet8 protein [Diplodia corticola]OJD37733.1 mitochondrial carrier protein pet8 protein [Diplodia corticola]
MSAFRSLARVPRTPIFAAQRMGFQTSALRFSGKETKLHEEGRPQEVEEHKQDSLKKSKEGKGHWKDELASDSESIVKADRGEVEASEETISNLQKETEKLAQQKK